MELKTQYQQRVDETERELQIVRNKILRISSLRVVLFLAGIFGVIYGYDAGAAALCLITALTFVPFLILVKFHNRLFFRKEWLETCIRVNQDEISALDNNYEPFDEGAVRKAALECKLVCTAEEGTIEGGIGEGILEALAANPPAQVPPVLTFGIPDEFVEQGKVPQLHHMLGIDSCGMAARIREKYVEL